MQSNDKVIEKYNKSAVQYARSRLGAEDRAELEKLKALLRPGDAVLDVGCAAGRDTRILHDMGLKATGVDLAEKLLEIAQKANPDIKFVLADVRQLPFKDGSFQAVWASAVLHHVAKPEMPIVLAEFYRILAPGGILYIHTKAGSGRLQTKEFTVLGAKRHFQLLFPEELEAMLQEGSFQKLELKVKPSKSRPGLNWITAFYRRA